MMLTVDEINLILNTLGRGVVVEPSDTFPYYITERRGFGYSTNPLVASIQAKLSIMLEVASKKPR